MKKTLLLLAMCLAASMFAYAQDDDVYFVPSSKNKQSNSSDTYVANPGRSTFSPIGGSGNSSSASGDVFSQSSWADNRGNGQWDVDAYNRRGKNYKGNTGSDTLTVQSIYDEGYSDGYEDGSCTARIVRFWSPRAGIYVSSPYWMDYADLYGYYDPFYYGYGSPWSVGWSGWWGWGSWYGYRPYYSSWWGWHEPWYDAWWGGPIGHPFHNNRPITAQRGPVGGWTNRGGARGSGPAVGYASNRGFESGRGSGNGTLGGRGFGVRSGASGNQNSGSVGNVQQGRGGGILGGRGFGNSTTQRSNVNTNTNTNANRSFNSGSSVGRGGGNLGGRGFGTPSMGSRGGSMGGGAMGGRGGGRGR